MGYRHSKDDILEGAIAAVFDDGLHQLTFGRLAKRLGISDRTIVYYFPSKQDLIAETLLELGGRLQTALVGAFSVPLADHRAFIRAVWPRVASTQSDPVFALFFEAAGLAAAGLEPYQSLVPALVDGWITWASGLLAGSPGVRRREATAAIAAIDGLLLLRQLAGPEVADVAARQLARQQRVPSAGTVPSRR